MGGACTTGAGPTNEEREQMDTIRKQQEEIDRLTEHLRKQQEENAKLKDQLTEPTTETASLMSPSNTKSNFDDTDEEHDPRSIEHLLKMGGQQVVVDEPNEQPISSFPENIDDSTVLNAVDNTDDLSIIVSQYIRETENRQPHFDLLYRSSRDGDDAQTFHHKCDERGPTVTLIRDQNLNIFGGYNSLSWRSPSSPESRRQEKSFLFILKSTQFSGQNEKVVPNKFELDRTDAENFEFATQDDATKGPLFGISDLYLDTKFSRAHATNGSFGNCTYDMAGDERYLTPHEHFYVVDLEVYSVKFGN